MELQTKIPEQEELLTVDEVRVWLRLGRTRVNELLQTGSLRPSRSAGEGLSGAGCSGVARAASLPTWTGTLTGERQIMLTPLSGITPERASDSRARAWSYIFKCLDSHKGKEGGAETAPDYAKEIKNVRGDEHHNRLPTLSALIVVFEKSGRSRWPSCSRHAARRPGWHTRSR